MNRRAALPAVWTFLPLFAVEQAANYFYLADNQAVFFTISGMRFGLFILIAALGSVAAGRWLHGLWTPSLSVGGGILGALVTFYAECDPRVCFSSGIDGFEPLRLVFVLIAVCVSGVALGESGQKQSFSKNAIIMIGFFGFAAVSFTPVAYTFAGTKILWWLDPWAVLALLALTGYSVATTLGSSVSRKSGLVVPVASLGAVMLLSAGIAASYLPSLMDDTLLMLAATVIAASIGVLRAGHGRNRIPAGSSGGRYLLGVLFVYFLLVFAVPDAVNGVVPSTSGEAPSFTIGVPVYAGAYMDAPAGHALGAGVTVDFGSTDSSFIQPGNYLAAGLGIHAAGCCVDGIDYAYRSDVYLFHDGSKELVATGWEACDNNAACGGHSWKLLIFQADMPIAEASTNQSVELRVQWGEGLLVWTYSSGGGPFVEYAHFSTPKAENHDFNTGVLAGGGLNLVESGVYFFQFGVMSRTPITRSGWNVELRCPSLLPSSPLGASWSCVDHARTVQGGQSFWKAIWRWGEDYPGVTISESGYRAMIFQYAQSSQQNFEGIW